MIWGKIKKYGLWILAGFGIAAISFYINSRVDYLQGKLIEADATIDTMKKEHNKAIIAVNEAFKERKEIYEQAKERLCEAERRIGQNSAFCEQSIPDDLMLWKDSITKRNSTGDNVQPTE